MLMIVLEEQEVVVVVNLDSLHILILMLLMLFEHRHEKEGMKQSPMKNFLFMSLLLFEHQEQYVKIVNVSDLRHLLLMWIINFEQEQGELLNTRRA